MASGHLVKRSKGHWSVVIERGMEDGKRAQKWYSGYRTEELARDAMITMLYEVNTGQFIDPTGMSVAEWLDRWLKDFCLHLSPYTLRGYEDTVQLVKDEVGKVPLQKLTTAKLQQMIAKWQTEGTSAGRGPISPNTIKKNIICLSSALNKAVDLEMIRKNPAKKVSLPRVGKVEISALPLDDVPRLLEEAKDTSIWMPVLIALTTGMRRGEVLALKWKDINLEQAVACVQRNSVQVDGKIIMKEPKNGRSRNVALDPYLLSELRLHHKLQKEQRLAMGNRWQENDLVCTMEDGQPMKPEWVSWTFQYWAKKHGFDVTFHGLRHTHATMLLSQGVNLKVTQERLGHSTLAMTSDRYSHLTSEMQQTAVEAMGRVLGSVANG